jgi:hypothetical protein
MDLQHEAQRLQKRVVDAPRLKNPDVLKKVLGRALPELETTINCLPQSQRDEVWAIYLEELRRLAFGFHLALLEDQFRAKYIETENPALLGESKKCVKDVFRLYQFIA